jgi:hypothetical protein
MCKYSLDANLICLDMIHDPKTKIRQCSTETDFVCPLVLMIPVDFE